MPKGLPTVQLLTKYAFLVLARKQRLEIYKVEWMHTYYVIHNGIVFYYLQKPKKAGGKGR
jgi:hypothetical protein